jgi:hypothetical protein
MESNLSYLGGASLRSARFPFLSFSDFEPFCDFSRSSNRTLEM